MRLTQLWWRFVAGDCPGGRVLAGSLWMSLYVCMRLFGCVLVCVCVSVCLYVCVLVCVYLVVVWAQEAM